MIDLFPRAALSRDDLIAFAAFAGLSCESELPMTMSGTSQTFVGTNVAVIVASSGRLGAQAIRITGEAEATVAAMLASRFACESADDLVRAAARARTPAEQVRSIARLGLALTDVVAARDEVAALYRERLLDSNKAVRWAASLALQHATHEIADALIREAADVHADLGPVVRARAQTRKAIEDGTVFDAPTHDRLELLLRMKEGLRDGQLERVVLSASTLIRLDAIDDQAYGYRGLALRKRGERLRAFADLSIAIALGSRHRVDVTAWRTVRDELRDELRSAPPPSAPLLDVLDAVASLTVGRCDDLVEVAGELLAVPTGMEGALHFLAGWAHRRELEDRSARSCFEKAAELLPLPEVLSFARTSAGGDAVSPPSDPVATWTRDFIRRERFDAPASTEHGDESGEQAMMDRYSARDYAQAVALADALVEKDPKNLAAWQVRANARTFLQQHEDAIRAYGEAISAIGRVVGETSDDSFLVGEDPRGLMHFNRACELARAGRHDGALEDLEAAVSFQDRWAAKALEDEYFASLRGDPRLAAILQSVTERAGARHVRALADLRARASSVRAELERVGIAPRIAADVEAICARTIDLVEEARDDLDAVEDCIHEAAAEVCDALSGTRVRARDLFSVRSLLQALARSGGVDELAEEIDLEPY